jgi:YD repeat-containing protein
VNSLPSYNPEHPDQNLISRTVYDLSGNAIQQIDAMGGITRSYYDGVGRLRHVVQNY